MCLSVIVCVTLNVWLKIPGITFGSVANVKAGATRTPPQSDFNPSSGSSRDRLVREMSIGTHVWRLYLCHCCLFTLYVYDSMLANVRQCLSSISSVIYNHGIRDWRETDLFLSSKIKNVCVHMSDWHLCQTSKPSCCCSTLICSVIITVIHYNRSPINLKGITTKTWFCLKSNC